MRLGHQNMKKHYYFLSIASLWLFDWFLAAEDRTQQQQAACVHKNSKSKKAREWIFITDYYILFEYFINPAKKPPM